MWFGWILGSAISMQSWADLDAPSEQALHQTQSLLTSPTQRNEYLNQQPQAATADQQVKALTSSPEQQTKVYEISSEVFATTTQQSNGDVAKQQELLNKAAKNPEEFLKSLPPDQQNAIRGLAEQIEKNSKVETPQH